MQYVNNMAQEKQSSCFEELSECMQFEDELEPMVVGAISKDASVQSQSPKEKDARSPSFSRTTSSNSDPQSSNKIATLIETSNLNNNTLADLTRPESFWTSRDSEYTSQLPEPPLDSGNVQKWAISDVSEVVYAPLYPSSSHDIQEPVNSNTQPSMQRNLRAITQHSGYNNGTMNTHQIIHPRPLMDQAESHADVSRLREAFHVTSCPDLLISECRLQGTESSSHIVDSFKDWSPLNPKQSAVVEGVDEIAVLRLAKQTPKQGRNTSDPCLTSSNKTVQERNIVLQPHPVVLDISHACDLPDPVILGGSCVSDQPDPLMLEISRTSDQHHQVNHEVKCTSDQVHHYVSDRIYGKRRSCDLSETNSAHSQNTSTCHSSTKPLDEAGKTRSDRRESATVVFFESPRDYSFNEAGPGHHEHIELSSMSPTHRKRKFRRKRSLCLLVRSHSGKNKSGKTKKLCKKKKSSAAVTVTVVLPHAGHNPTALSEGTPSRTTKKAGRPGQILLGRPRAKTQKCTSLLCTRIHSSLKECMTRDGILAPLVVSSDTEATDSFTSPSFQGHSSACSWKHNFDHLTDDKQCLHIRRRSSVDKVRGVVVDGGEFTVVPVHNDANLLEQSDASRGRDKTDSLRVPLQSFDIDGEPSDTLTQNSITSLLSAKFRDVAKRWKQYGVNSPRFRKRLHSKWESMNYEEIDSQLQRTYNQENKSKKTHALTRLSSWVIYFFIGVGTAFMAAGVQISVELIAHQKFGLIRDLLDKCSVEDCLFQPVIIWISLNGVITLLGAALVTYVQPMAAGSGIPLIKSYLNGVRVPGLLSLPAFVAKCLGVILSILGGLACGKEGPMAHSGGIVAAGLGKGRIPWFKRDINLYRLFRTDHNIRDLVAAGAASGVSAAFGAPVGGTLFSVEEAASFWNTELVWKVFFSAMIACFSTNVLLSAFEGHPTQLSNPGLVRFNTFPNLTFDLIELPVFIFMAAIGGLIGSLFVVMNYKLTVFRQKYLHRKKWIKVVEATLVAVVSAVVAFIMMFSVRDCTNAEPYNHHAITTKMGCTGDSHNALSTLFLTTPEGCLKALLHDPLESYSVLSLLLFIVIFFLLGVWTYGLSVSSGVFIPSLAIGAAWGRLIGLGVVQLFPDQILAPEAKDVGKYALIGAASQLGGILRTTISLTVIIVECTGDISFGLCIMISLMISKWVGDFFTTGLYDMNIEVSGIPLLSWEPPPLCEHIHVNDFMSQPVMTLLTVEKVGHIYDCLTGETFHGFPVIQQDLSCELMYKGKLKGIILRHHILVLLNKRIFCPEGQTPTNSVDLSDFENSFSVSQSIKIEDIELSDADKECVMNLTPYMNQTPYTVSLNFSMPRVFRLFRGLGLRHLVVVNDDFEPIGMVTRKDLAKYRAEIKKGILHMEHLTVEDR